MTNNNHDRTGTDPEPDPDPDNNPADEPVEKCGAECDDGSVCENPADACGVPSHADPNAENPHGRPSKLDEHRDDILTGARQGMTLQGCARLAGVDESTLYRWIDKYEDFCKSLKRARAQGELKHLQSVNDAGSRFILERSFGYVKTERREVDADHTHDATQAYSDLVGAASAAGGSNAGGDGSATGTAGAGDDVEASGQGQG